MREEKTSTLEYGVYVLALLMAVFIGWQAYSRFGGRGASSRAGGPAETSASASRRGGGETESAVSMVPAIKLTSVGGRRKKAAAVPPPSK